MGRPDRGTQATSWLTIHGRDCGSIAPGVVGCMFDLLDAEEGKRWPPACSGVGIVQRHRDDARLGAARAVRARTRRGHTNGHPMEPSWPAAKLRAHRRQNFSDVRPAFVASARQIAVLALASFVNSLDGHVPVSASSSERVRCVQAHVGCGQTCQVRWVRSCLPLSQKSSAIS